MRRPPRLLSAACASIAAFALAGPAAARPTAPPTAVNDGLTVTLDQPSYKIGDNFVVTTEGNPGDYAFLLFGLNAGETVFPPIGTLGILLDSTAAVVNLKFLPPSGQKSVQCDILCDSPLADVPFFLQAYAVNLLEDTWCVSNVVEVLFDSNNNEDCNSNGIADICEVFEDCNTNGIPDECEPDCDLNGIPDSCELIPDCNGNEIPDNCDITSGDSTDLDGNGIPDECDPDCDGDGIPDAAEPDCDMNGTPDDCELIPDCNGNSIPDNCDITSGNSTDLDGNGIPDECDPDCDGDGIPDAAEPDCDMNGTPDDCELIPDCNGNSIPDNCDITSGNSTDLDGNGIPDECDPDCDGDGIPDAAEPDCDMNGTPDDCELIPDCNGNSIPDNCDITSGNSTDLDGNGIPDECDPDCDNDGIPDAAEPDCDMNGTPDDCELIPDCNGNSIPDNCDITSGNSTDLDGNGIPDECDPDCDNDGIPDAAEPDCDMNGTPDDCELIPDCNGNEIPDNCDITSGNSTDLDGNGIPDECDPDCDNDGIPDAAEPDCDMNGTPDDCELIPDCNGNSIPDNCDITSGNSTDLDGNGIPDECDPDCDGDGIPDAAEPDCDMNGTPDDCELIPDCNGNSIPDNCDITSGNSTDLDGNGVPDECDPDCDEALCFSAAVGDEFSSSNSDHAFWFGSCLGSDWQVSDQIDYIENGDGTAQIRGRIERESDPDACFYLDIQLAGAVSPGDGNYPPSGSPKLGPLKPEALAENGGPADTNLWRYYEDVSGSLLGCRDNEGAIYRFERRGEAFQIGIGASQKNVNFGASMWFTIYLEQDSIQGGLPHECVGDINVDVIPCPPVLRSVLCVDSAEKLDGSYDVGLTPSGLDGFDFESAQFVEDGDGYAILTGILRSEADGANSFRITAVFEDRVLPGDSNYPPLGSPILELASEKYDSAGGPINPDTWRYYENVRLVLRGEGGFEGALMKAKSNGTALQLGDGANGHNLNPGSSSWLNAWTLEQPDHGDPFPWDPSAEMRFDLSECLDPCDPTTGGPDCDFDGIPDAQEADCDYDGIPDDCEPDCDADGIPDDCDNNHPQADKCEVSDPVPVSDHPYGGTFGALVSDNCWKYDYKRFSWSSDTQFEEYSDGTARFWGSLESHEHPGSKLHVDITLWNKADWGSPYLGGYSALPSQYFSPNGPVDTDEWTYYREAFGNVSGSGKYAGVSLGWEVDEPEYGDTPFQVGTGASGRNVNYGAGGWFFSYLYKQPWDSSVCFWQDSYEPWEYLELLMDIECPSDCGPSYAPITAGTVEGSVLGSSVGLNLGVSAPVQSVGEVSLVSSEVLGADGESYRLNLQLSEILFEDASTGEVVYGAATGTMVGLTGSTAGEVFRLHSSQSDFTAIVIEGELVLPNSSARAFSSERVKTNDRRQAK